MEIESVRLMEVVDVGNERTSYLSSTKFVLKMEKDFLHVKLKEDHKHLPNRYVLVPMNNVISMNLGLKDGFEPSQVSSVGVRTKKAKENKTIPIL